MRLLPVWILAAVTGVAACAQLLDFDSLTDSADASVPLADAAPPVVAPVAEYHVSPAGDDAQDGSTQRPLRSLGEAARRATARLATEPAGVRLRIALCAGDYPERPLELAGPIDVTGDYDCSTWQRIVPAPEAAGSGVESRSRIQDLQAAGTLVQSAATSAGGARLESLTFLTTQSQIAVTLGSGSTARYLTITNTAPRERAEAAVAALGAAGPDTVVEHCSLNVNNRAVESSAARAFASDLIGVVGGGGSLRLASNAVYVGDASGSCQGMYLTESGGIELLENRIELANCNRPAGEPPAGEYFTMMGVRLFNTTTRSTRNAIQLEGVGTWDPTRSSAAFGIVTTGTRDVLTSDGDRIVGPLLRRSNDTSEELVFVGVRLGEGVIERVTNLSVVVRAGNFDLSNGAAVRLDRSSQTLLAHNSVFLESRNPDDGQGVAPARAFHLVQDAPGANSVTLYGNLVISGTASHKVARGSCATPQLVAIAGNRYAGMAGPADGASCEGDARLERLVADGGAADNEELTCVGGCAQLLQVAPAEVLRNGLQVLDGNCDRIRIPSRADVSTDANGVARGDAGTLAGALHECGPRNAP